jgi:hypothetical protein
MATQQLLRRLAAQQLGRISKCSLSNGQQSCTEVFRSAAGDLGSSKRLAATSSTSNRVHLGSRLSAGAHAVICYDACALSTAICAAHLCVVSGPPNKLRCPAITIF